jgi:AAHS family 4-hydroxybenzoate transporter-like MFS transporter
MTQTQNNLDWTAYARWIVGLIVLGMMLDGLDAQLLGLAIPSLIRDWGVTRGDLTPITAGSLVGMALGATFGGWFGDRFGRRTGLICSLLLFGLATGIASQVNGLVLFGVLRAFAGMGLGAALPNGTALIAEFTPLRHRSMGASIAMLSQPVGSMVAGVLAAVVLESAGWRTLFIIGGIAPLLVALLYWRVLPESPAYLAGRDQQSVSASPGSLLTAELRRDTLLLWLACFMALMALYTMLSWGPAMLAAAGYPLGFAGRVVTTFSVGGIVGSLAVGVLCRKAGSRTAQAVIGVVGVAAAMVLCVLFSRGQPAQATVLVLMAGIGFSAAGSQATLYVLSTHFYPTWLRATGIGLMLGVGRLGAVASSWAGSASLDLGGPVAFFVLFAVAVSVATLACRLVSRPVRAADSSAGVNPV